MEPISDRTFNGIRSAIADWWRLFPSSTLGSIFIDQQIQFLGEIPTIISCCFDEENSSNFRLFYKYFPSFEFICFSPWPHVTWEALLELQSDHILISSGDWQISFMIDNSLEEPLNPYLLTFLEIKLDKRISKFP